MQFFVRTRFYQNFEHDLRINLKRNKRDYIVKLFYVNICNVSIDKAIIFSRIQILNSKQIQTFYLDFINTIF